VIVGAAKLNTWAGVAAAAVVVGAIVAWIRH